MDILVIIVGIWFMALGAYSFYYASSTKKTGNIKAGWVVGKDIQLKNCKDTKGFINAIYNKTLIFASVDMAGGLGIIIGQLVDVYVVELICMIILVVFYFRYSSQVKDAQKKYLSPSFSAKAKRKL